MVVTGCVGYFVRTLPSRVLDGLVAQAAKLLIVLIDLVLVLCVHREAGWSIYSPPSPPQRQNVAPSNRPGFNAGLVRW
jgi:hypothetical protein